ncbi:MAG: SLC13 family permease [Chthoniobacterales bacterium]
MTIPIAIVLGLLLIAIVIFASEKVSVDIVTLGLLIVLVLCRILTPSEAFEGFSSDIIIILGSIFVISAALQETGVLEVIGARLLQLAGASSNRLLFLLMTVVAGVSAFMNNTTVTAMFLPPTMGLAKKARISPSKLLIPLAYASILGGTCTLIGTSTNVAVSGFIQKAGMQPLGFFEITPIGLVIVAIGIAYTMLIGQRLLPNRRDESQEAGQAIREYLSEIIVLPNSPLIGQRAFDSDLTILDFTILKVIRGDQELPPTARLEMREGDTVLVEGNIENLIKVKGIEGIAIKPELEQGDLQRQNGDFRIAEVLITPRSDLLNRTLRESQFRQRFGLTVLALFRHGQTLQKTIRNVRLEVGDLLLVQGAEERVDMLRHDPGMSIIEQRAAPVYEKSKGLYTVGFFAAALVVSGIGWVPPSIAFLAAALLSILLRCISIERAYEFIDWRLLILIGGMTAFGTAMEKTGAAE